MMKHHILSLALMSALLLAGCAKQSDIENLQEQIDTIKSDQIESIESQIESIRKSITSLEGTDTALQEYINALQEQITSLKNSEEENSEEIEALQKALETLQEKDKNLQEQINALKDYADNLASDTEKWANATFATIEQYDSTSKIIADIQSQIETINSKLTSTEETLAAYKTIIDSINDTIAAMKLDIEAIQKQVKDLLARIQSISYVPKFSDGKAVMTYYTDSVAIVAGTAEFDFELKPASAAKEIATLWTANPEILTMNAVYTITKSAPEIDTLAIESVSADNGFISVKVSGKALKDEFFKGQCSASVRLSISDGNNDMTTDYIPMAPEATDMKVITFGDAKFRTYCVNNFDTDGDGMISEEEAKAVTRIECSLAGLTSLVGIEYFSDLEYIDVSCNSLASLNLKNNTALETLHCRKNSLTVLDVTKLTALKDLDCSNNAITALNLSALAALETLRCGTNSLQNLAVGANVTLTTLECEANTLKTLDLSKNVLLETLDCSDNALTSLDVSRNAALVTVDCSGNANLAKLWVKDASQKSALTVKKDDATVIAYNDGGINIPDAALKSYLLALFDDDEDGEISIRESENIENVNCAGKGIADLTGLECCVNLKYLNFNGNSVKKVELPNLAKLETIVAYGNPIERLNVNNDTALTKLYLQDVSTNALNGSAVTITAYDQAATLSLAFAGTAFTELNLTGSMVLTSYDIAENTQLTKLVASGNTAVTGVDLSTLTALTYLDIKNNALTALNVDTSTALQTFDCSGNSLTALSVDNNVELVTFDCSDNNLSTLKVSNNTALETLDCSNNSLLNINVRKNTALKDLNVSGNSGITALALAYNTALETLDASSTGLSDIDLAKNTAIKSLSLNSCSAMSIIDLSANTALETLRLSSTPLATLDVSNNTSLATLDVSNNTSLATLDVSNTSLTILDVNGLNISSLKITGTMSSLVGQYVVCNGIKGVIFSASSSVVKIMSTTETTTTWDYYGTTTGATSDTDGAANTDKIASGSSAAKWCRAIGSEWYLPAKSELSTIYSNKSTLNATLFAIGGTQLSWGYYWSSTEYSSNRAYYIYFGTGKVININKSNPFCVRAVREL